MIFLVSGTTQSLTRSMGEYPDRLGVLLTPSNRNSIRWVLSTGLPWACDNGAFSGFDPARFRNLLGRVAGQPGLLWVVCPDVVADAAATLALFDEWEPELRAAGVPVAFVAQNGQDRWSVPWGRTNCLFLGGSKECQSCGYVARAREAVCPECWRRLTEWKLSYAAGALVHEAKRRGLWVHMGRVNSLRRIRAAYEIGCDSVDGSSASRWGDKYTRQFPRWIGRVQEQGRFHA